MTVGEDTGGYGFAFSYVFVGTQVGAYQSFLGGRPGRLEPSYHSDKGWGSAA